jgi:hypothetical protein
MGLSFIQKMHWDLSLPYSSCYSLTAFSEDNYQETKIWIGLAADTALDL